MTSSVGVYKVERYVAVCDHCSASSGTSNKEVAEGWAKTHVCS